MRHGNLDGDFNNKLTAFALHTSYFDFAAMEVTDRSTI